MYLTNNIQFVLFSYKQTILNIIYYLSFSMLKNIREVANTFSYTQPIQTIIHNHDFLMLKNVCDVANIFSYENVHKTKRFYDFV